MVYIIGEKAMDRTQELVGLIKEHWVAHIETKKKYLMLHYMDMKPEFCKKLNYLIDGQRNREKDCGSKKVQTIYLNRLLSSIYTESYDAILGIANTDLYLDQEKSETYWFPDLVYRNIDEDMKKIEVLLRKGFIRLEEYELFQLRKILLNDDWELIQEVFLNLIKESIGLILNSELHMESELQIISGNYMDKPKVLWCVSTIDNVES